MSNVNPVAPAPQPRAPKSPAIIWTAVLALIPLLIDWLQGEYFSGEDWVLLAVALLTMAARFIEVYVAQLKAQEAGAAETPRLMSMAGASAPTPPAAVQWKQVLVEAIFG